MSEETLPPYFPLKTKKCAKVSEAFFDCYETESAPNGDKDVGKKALITCAQQLGLYKDCMDKFVGPKAKDWF
ncbi:hypothetical protein HDV01_000054 [Terramyces sp. JEL0728]|nr:hypothetical protein HDV01_000054 [Terramyces sp. JEL0728]